MQMREIASRDGVSHLVPDSGPCATCGRKHVVVVTGINPRLPFGHQGTVHRFLVPERAYLDAAEMRYRGLHVKVHVEPYCAHADSLYGRCVDCGLTWEGQQAQRGEFRG